jgi:phage head maturation protease
MKSLFNHGMDFGIGDKLLGTVSSLSEEKDSPVALVDLYDEASYVRDLIPGLRAGDYGSSFMFEVLRDSWNHEPEPSDYNPEGLPERDIEEVRLLEAGPVTFPANPAATAGLRSGCHTDAFIERQIERGLVSERDTLAMFDAFRAANRLPGRDAPAPEAKPAPARHVSEYEAKRAARLRELTLIDLTGGMK